MEKLDLDKILISINGWGTFQKLYYLSLCSVIIFSVVPMGYIFTARDIKYRCKIESCHREQEEYSYNPRWLKNAVPFQEDIPNRCLYFEPNSNNTCTNFNRNKTLICNEFIFERNQTALAQDFNITCDENLWKLTMVGTINVLGELFCLPFAGFLSDKFGRKSMVIVSVFFSSLIGIVKSFSVSYFMYLIFEFIDTALGSGMYSGAFILAIEIVDSKRRNVGNTIICIAFAFGQILLATAAWISPTWRTMLRIIYTPGLLIVVLLWFTPESLRWLISKNRTNEAWKILKSIARINRTHLDEDVFNKLPLLSHSVEQEKREEKAPLLEVFKSKTLVFRTIHCSFTWVCCNFPYYGLTIQSVALSQDIYLNFICTSVVEVPAYLLTYGALDKFGRRKSLAISLIFAGLACSSINFVDKESWMALIVFLCGKFFITMAYATVYIYTAEMFPTSTRHSTFAICSMCGRLGAMLAPQVPLLARINTSLPLLVFSAMALSSGILAFFFPETHNTKLPDQISEAVNINEDT